MFISENTTDFPTDITVFTDKDGRDWCVTVAKATYDVDPKGIVSLAEEQLPLLTADEHFGKPEETSAEYEYDFAPYKPVADVLVNGHVYAPEGKATSECRAVMRVGSLVKVLRVSGPRHWTMGESMGASSAELFERVALRYENAFGGMDYSHADEEHQAADLRNPIGCAFRKNPNDEEAEGQPLPQLEYDEDPPIEWGTLSRPASLGVVGRGWQPRIGFAGTYDEAWSSQRAPFLPEDFDMRFFQAAPVDQQLKTLAAGTPIQLENLSAEGVFSFSLPKLSIPIRYLFADRTERPKMVVDTLVLEPDHNRFLLTCRSSVPLGRKHDDLKEIKVGDTDSESGQGAPE